LPVPPPEYAPVKLSEAEVDFSMMSSMNEPEMHF